MSVMGTGIVKNSVVVPDAPLPEWALVEIRQQDQVPEVPPELAAEFAAWQLAGAQALALVEKLAEESSDDEAR